jgi:hypothetical protein
MLDFSERLARFLIGVPAGTKEVAEVPELASRRETSTSGGASELGSAAGE